MMNSFSQLTNPNLTVRAFFYAKKYAMQVHDVTAIFTSLFLKRDEGKCQAVQTEIKQK